jgi:hypothetical protein
VTLINCPQCGKEISCNLASCPHCGADGQEFQSIAVRKNLNLPPPGPRKRAMDCEEGWIIVCRLDDAGTAALERHASAIMADVYGGCDWTGECDAISELTYNVNQHGGLSQIERGQREEAERQWLEVLVRMTGDSRACHANEDFILRPAEK